MLIEGKTCLKLVSFVREINQNLLSIPYLFEGKKYV